MFEERYKRVTEGIHADEDLIERTLDAAETPPTKAIPWHRGFLLAAGAVCAFVLIVIASARIVPPPKDIVASNGETPGNSEEFLPLPSKLPSDDLTLSVSDVQLVSDTELSFILTVRGDKVDPLTYISIDEHTDSSYIAGGGLGVVDEIEDRQPCEKRFLYTIESRDRPILGELGTTLELMIDWYSSGDTVAEIVHEIDWDSMNLPLPEAGEPIIDLGSGLAVTGFGFTKEGWLTVQTRWPFESPEQTLVFTWLSADGTNDSSTNFYMREGKQYVAGDHIYNNQTFYVTQDELDGMHLVTYISLAGEIIEGYWPINVDLTHLIAE